jgi:hypothetical protein
MYKFHIPREKLYLLSNNNNDLSGGAMISYQPALSVYEPKSTKSKKIKTEFGGGEFLQTSMPLGSTPLPLQPRTNGRDQKIIELSGSTVGGLPTIELADTKKKYYFVVNSIGTPVKNGDVSYYASSPSSAAVKAFYAWWRTSKQGSKCLERSSVVDFRTSLVPPELLQHLMAMQTEKVSQEAKKEFVKQFLCIDTIKIQRQILIRIGAAGGKSSVRAYLVAYKKNLSPNPLEVLNKMVVIASATPIPLTNQIPANVIEYETLT